MITLIGLCGGAKNGRSMQIWKISQGGPLHQVPRPLQALLMHLSATFVVIITMQMLMVLVWNSRSCPTIGRVQSVEHPKVHM